MTDAGIVIDINELHPANVESPMSLIWFGIVIDVILLQSEKAQTPIYVTELGIVIEVRLLHPANILNIDNQQLIR